LLPRSLNRQPPWKASCHGVTRILDHDSGDQGLRGFKKAISPLQKGHFNTDKGRTN
jgi:hypothetical protein